MFLPQQKTCPCNFCKRMQRLRRGQSVSVRHYQCRIYFSPWKISRQVKKLSLWNLCLQYRPLSTGVPYVSSLVKISSLSLWKTPSRFTVVTLCALLTHYLLAIAKFLGKFGNPLSSRKWIKLDSSNLNLVCRWFAASASERKIRGCCQGNVTPFLNIGPHAFISATDEDRHFQFGM